MIAPACASEKVDTTGAGDAFIASFMAEYAISEDLVWCAAVEPATASAVVETVVPSIKINRSGLLERARIEYLT